MSWVERSELREAAARSTNLVKVARVQIDDPAGRYQQAERRNESDC